MGSVACSVSVPHTTPSSLTETSTCVSGWHARRYGSYGYSLDPGFHKLILPYLDRGMIYAMAHVRGGGEMGRYW